MASRIRPVAGVLNRKPARRESCDCVVDAKKLGYPFPVCKQYFDTALEQFAVHVFADTHANICRNPQTMGRFQDKIRHFARYIFPCGIGSAQLDVAGVAQQKACNMEGGFFIGQCF